MCIPSLHLISSKRQVVQGEPLKPAMLRLFLLRLHIAALAYHSLLQVLEARPSQYAGQAECPAGFFSCTLPDLCMPLSWRCDGTSDCENELDEADCERRATTNVVKRQINNCTPSPDAATPGDQIDNDCDGMVDEERANGRDDDNDGLIDEDLFSYPPTIDSPVYNRTVGCASSLDVRASQQPLIRALDPCQFEPVDVTHSDVIEDVGCGNLYVLRRVWRAVDVCGNEVGDVQFLLDVCDERVRRVVDGNDSVCEFGTCDALKEDARCFYFTVSCQVSQWTPWTDCVGICDMAGERWRMRLKLVEPTAGGNQCPSLREAVSCDPGPCVQDCEVSVWSEWHCEVPCGVGQQTRNRNVTKKPFNGGVDCPHLREEETCNPGPCVAVDCEVSQWSEWECNVNCSVGQQTRQRQIVTKPSNSGQDCPRLRETSKCDAGPCPIDCEVSQWSNWTECNTKCLTGDRSRFRVILRKPSNGGIECPPLLFERETCDAGPCPVDCVTSDWSQWSECNTTCGHGWQQRSRNVTKRAVHGGQSCGNVDETRSCNRSCSIDCKVTTWSNWSDCDVTCGSGYRSRDRVVITKPSDGGKECSILLQMGICNVGVCGIDCVVSLWSSWSECDNTCGRGNQSRGREITTVNVGAGSECPVLIDTRVCNGSRCPIDCIVGLYAAVGECSASCGGGMQRYTRTITTKPQNGGTACPTLEKHEECNTFLCAGSCSSRMNLLFLIDVSGSISMDDCMFAQDYMRSVTLEVEIGDNFVHVGAMTFNGAIEYSFPFLSDRERVDEGFSMLRCTGGWTSISTAFATANDVFMTSSKPEVERNVLVLISDGRDSNEDEVRVAADDLKSVGVETFVVGVGNYEGYEDLLTYVASEPSDRHLIFSSDYRVLSRYVNTLVGYMCNVSIDCVLSEWRNATECSTTCDVGRLTQQRDVIIKPSSGGKKCSEQTRDIECVMHPCVNSRCVKDVVIILDYSSSIMPDVFRNEVIRFTFDLVLSFPIGDDDVLVSIVLFNGDATTDITFDGYETKHELLDRIERLEYRSGFTNIPSAMFHTIQTILLAPTGHRSYAPDYVVMVTDGLTDSLFYLPYLSVWMKSVTEKVIVVGIVDLEKPSGVALAVFGWVASGEEYVHVVEAERVREMGDVVSRQICPAVMSVVIVNGN